MSDYDQSDAESQISDRTPSEYSYSSKTGLDELDQQLTEHEENKKKYNDLIEDQYLSVLQFNEGLIDADIYFSRLKQINDQLEAIEYEDFETDQKLIEEEVKFKTLLDEFISKISRKYPKQKKGFLTYFDLQRIKAIRFIIKEIQERYEQDDDEPLESNAFLFNFETLNENERDQITEMARIRRIPLPVRTEFNNESEFLIAEERFYDTMAIYFPTYFTEFQLKEKKEIENLAKRLKIPKPKEASKIEQFYIDVAKLLPGYKLKMNERSIGYTYEVMDAELLREKVMKEREALKNLPIKLSGADAAYQEKIKVYKQLLNKMEISELINCASETRIKKQEPEPQKEYLRTERVKDFVKIERKPEELIERPKQKYKYLPVTVEDTQALKKEKLKLLSEQIRYHDQKSVKIKNPPLNVEPTKINIRLLSKARIINSLNQETPIQLRIIIPGLAKKLEDYIFKLSENEIAYLNRIEDILFIFDNYPGFKLNFLLGKYNVYQIVLFEKEIVDNARVMIFPISVNSRRNIVKRLNQEFIDLNLLIDNSFIQTIKTIKDLSKKLELMLLDISQNEYEYFQNTKKLINIIRENHKILSFDEAFQLFTKPKEKPKKIDYDKLSIKELDVIVSQKIQLEKELTKNFNKILPRELNEVKAELIEIKKILEEKKFIKDGNKTDFEQNYINSLKYKFEETEGPKTYQIIDTALVTQIIQGYKRRLIMKDLKLNQNLISTLELYDFNELQNKLYFNGNNIVYSNIQEPGFLKILNTQVYEKNKKSLLADIKLNNEIIQKYFKQSLNTLIEFLGISSETNTLSEQIDLIVKNWPKEYSPQNVFVDYYGNDLFLKMYNTKDPVDFYDPMILKSYDALLKKNAIPGIEPVRIPRILYKEVGDKVVFGSPDGTMYDVLFLDKDYSKNPPEPLNQYKVIMEKDPRTKSWIAVNKIVKKRGPFPFILRHIGTNQIGESKEVWTEVPLRSVKMYALDYDSCSRFRNENDCSGAGINNSTCEWKNKSCRANYNLPFSFGKVKKIYLKKAKGHYSLKDNSSKRQSDLIKRIKYEQKKTKNLKKAAVAVKRRLVVLRTYRKNNPSMKKQVNILNKDIKFIDKKYLLKLK